MVSVFRASFSIVLVLAGPPTSVDASTTCDNSNGNQVNLLWTPPTNTGGQGVMITHYNITGLPQSASCSTGPCDMVDVTMTTITGLQCGDEGYNVSVSAVNCRGVGNASQVMMISLNPPGMLYLMKHMFQLLLSPQGKPLFDTARINNGYLTLHWTVSLMMLKSNW